MAFYESSPRWNDRPPTYERLLVDTLVDIRRNAHKHAILNSSRVANHHQPISPISPNSDLTSIHTNGTFEIDLKSIWSQKTATSTLDRLSLASSEPSSRASSPARERPRSLGDESFFPTPVSPVSFLPHEDDDDDLIHDPLDLDADYEEPAPAYDADSSGSSSPGPSTRPSSSMTFSNHTRMPSTSTVASAATFNQALLSDEDPWEAFAAVCWAACVHDDPHNPPAHAFGRHATTRRPSAPFIPARIAEELESEPEPEPSLLAFDRGTLRYNSTFSRTEPDLTVGIWSSGDNAVARALGLDDDVDLDLEFERAIESRRLRPTRVDSPDIAPRVHKLEYIPPRQPSPPRTFYKKTPAYPDVAFVPASSLPLSHSRNNSGGFKRLWRWRGKENSVF